MGGNLTKELCKHYCLRGLEPYQSPSLNAEMHSHRCMHHQTVLKEQKRQRKANITDPVRIAQQVSHMSEWALRRAQKLAVQDAQDVLLQTDTSSRSTSSSRQQQQQRRSSWHGHPATTPTPTATSHSASTSAVSAVTKLVTSSSHSSSSRSRVSSSSSRRRRSLPNATPVFANTTSTASTVTSATSISSASSSSSLSSSSDDQQQYHQATAVDVDQLRAWNANLLQRMMSDQRHRRHSMTNPNASLAHSSAGARRNMSNSIRNIGNIINSSSNIINNANNANNAATSVSNSLDNLHCAQTHASNEMSLHSLLVVPRTEMLAKQNRGTPDFSSTNSLPGASAGAGVGSVDGNDGSSSNSMPSNTNIMPYRSFLRRDSLCGFKQL
jgi:hypothetical protein